MRKIEATEKNAKTVNRIIDIFCEAEYTVEEAYSILEFTKGRIRYTSNVGNNEKLTFE